MSFITVAIEGPDGYLKTTLAKSICEATGALYVKYPDEEEFAGHECRRQLNAGIKDVAGFQALQTLNRFATLQKLYEGGDLHGLVVLDRWTFSALVYGMTDGLPITWLNKISNMLPKPDLTILIAGKSYRMGDTDAYSSKQARVVDLYNRLSALIDDPVYVIDNTAGYDYLFSTAMYVLNQFGYIDDETSAVNSLHPSVLTHVTSFDQWADKHGLRPERS